MNVAFKVGVPKSLFYGDYLHCLSSRSRVKKDALFGVVATVQWKTNRRVKNKKQTTVKAAPKKKPFRIQVGNTKHHLMAYHAILWFALDDLKSLFSEKRINTTLSQCRTKTLITYDALTAQWPGDRLQRDKKIDNVIPMDSEISTVQYQMTEFTPQPGDIFIDELTLYFILCRMREYHSYPSPREVLYWLYQNIIPGIRMEIRLAAYKTNQKAKKLMSTHSTWITDNEKGQASQTTWCVSQAVNFAAISTPDNEKTGPFAYLHDACTAADNQEKYDIVEKTRVNDNNDAAASIRQEERHDDHTADLTDSLCAVLLDDAALCEKIWQNINSQPRRLPENVQCASSPSADCAYAYQYQVDDSAVDDSLFTFYACDTMPLSPLLPPAQHNCSGEEDKWPFSSAMHIDDSHCKSDASLDLARFSMNDRAF